MRVCQFRHYGTVNLHAARSPEHANRERQSFNRGRRCQFLKRPRRRGGLRSFRLLVAANSQVARRLRLLIQKGVYLVKEGCISK